MACHLFGGLATLRVAALTGLVAGALEAPKEEGGSGNGSAWTHLAKEVGFARRFLTQRMEPFVEQVLDTAEELAKGRVYANPLVEAIVNGIRRRSERFRRELAKGRSPSKE